MFEFALLSAAIVSNSPVITPRATCLDKAEVYFHKESELPAGVLAAFGAPMADKDEPFQQSDNVVGVKMPWYRFLSGAQRGCTINITYEYGGRGSGKSVASIVKRDSRWILVGDLIYHDRAGLR